MKKLINWFKIRFAKDINMRADWDARARQNPYAWALFDTDVEPRL